MTHLIGLEHRPVGSRCLARTLVLAGSLASLPAPSIAQLPDARVLPRGVLRISFEPEYTNYDRRFSLGTPGIAGGTPERLGTDLTADTVGSNFFPSLVAPEAAIRAIIGDSTYRINIGSFDTELDADLRRFPLDLAFGLTDRLTMSVRVPIVTSRMNASVVFDSTDGNAGWNPASDRSGIANGAGEIAALLSELNAAANWLDTEIASGAFGCPMGPTCGSARTLLTRARLLVDNLATLTGVPVTGAVGTLPPFVPTRASAAGAAILNEIAGVIAEFQTFGAPTVTASLPLPDSVMSTGGVEAVFPDPAFGYEAFPLQTTRQSGFGDVEIEFRYALASAENVRALVRSMVRLPTGRHDATNHFIDLGTGDRQTDIEAGFEVALSSPAGLGVALDGSYTFQLADERPRRITPPDRPIALRIDEFTVQRNLGNIVRLSAHPFLHLSHGFRVFASALYYRKGLDSFSSASPINTSSGSAVEDLALESSMRTFSFGAGVAYRSLGKEGQNSLPIEAGLSYRSTFSGTGGLTPKSNILNIYLRLYYQIFGAVEAVEGTQEEPS